MNGDARQVFVKERRVYGARKKIPKNPDGIGHLIFRSCEKFADNVCQIYAKTGETQTFAAFKEQSKRVALQLRRRGLKKGDVVTLCSPNVLEAALVPAAALYLGAAFSAIDPSISARDSSHLLAIVEPTFVFVHIDSLPLIEEVRLMRTDLDYEVVVIGGSTKYARFEEFLKESNEELSFHPVPMEGDDVSFVIYSSGTSGLPKGICLTHDSIYKNALLYMQAVNDPSCNLHFTSLYWVSATTMFVGQFLNGSSRLLVIGFDPSTAFRDIAKYKVSALFMASNYSYQINKDILRGLDMSHLKHLIYGGLPLALEQRTKLRQLFPKSLVTSGYGMTEFSGFISIFTTQDIALLEKHPDSCGRPLPNFIIKVVNPETEELLNIGESGEIRVKSDCTMKGYYNQDSASSFDDEGYLKTGDLGYYDEDGCLYVYDRIKDMFKYQSWHIVPASLESILLEHPEVEDAAVFGVPHEEDGHRPAAIVVLKAGSVLTPEEVEKYVAERVADRQRLRGGVYIVDKLPRTATNKIPRRKLMKLVTKIGK